MNIDLLIKNLTEAPEAKRRFDAEIAQATGWKSVTAPSAEHNGQLYTTWYRPGTHKAARVPDYTTDLQKAYELFEALCPSSHVGVTWGSGFCSAGVLNGSVIEKAATPALALCALALSEYSRRKQE